MTEPFACFLDYEASSLSLYSYPIQAAWSRPDASISMAYIHPESAWTDWDEVAAGIHQIPRERLFEQGQPARLVAQQMNAELAGQTVYCDGGEMDMLWQRRLFAAADLTPSFVLRDIISLFHVEVLFHDDLWPQYEREARDRVAGRRHLAQHDVAYLIELYKLVMLPSGGTTT